MQAFCDGLPYFIKCILFDNKNTPKHIFFFMEKEYNIKYIVSDVLNSRQLGGISGASDVCRNDWRISI